MKIDIDGLTYELKSLPLPRIVVESKKLWFSCAAYNETKGLIELAWNEYPDGIYEEEEKEEMSRPECNVISTEERFVYEITYFELPLQEDYKFACEISKKFTTDKATEINVYQRFQKLRHAFEWSDDLVNRLHGIL